MTEDEIRDFLIERIVVGIDWRAEMLDGSPTPLQEFGFITYQRLAAG